MRGVDITGGRKLSKREKGLIAYLDTEQKVHDIMCGDIKVGSTVYADIKGDTGMWDIVEIQAIDGDTLTVYHNRREEVFTIPASHVYRPGRD